MTYLTNKEMFIHIKEINDAQKIAIESMLHYFVKLGEIGCTRTVSFLSDGDGNFRPKILVDGEQPKLWHGYPEARVACDRQSINIDFDTIAWQLNNN